MLALSVLAMAVGAVAIGILAPSRSALRSLVTIAPAGVTLIAACVIHSVTGYSRIADRAVYMHELKIISRSSFEDLRDGVLLAGREPFYIAFMKITSLAGDSSVALYTSVAVVVSLLFIGALRLLIPLPEALAIYAVQLSLGFFLAYAGVAIRQGLGMGFILLAVALKLSGQKPSFQIAASVAAALFHWSALPFILVAMIAARGKERALKLWLRVWCVCSVLYVVQLSQYLVEPISSVIPRLSNYAMSTGNSEWRLDFWLFSGLALGISLFLRRLPGVPTWYDRLIATYVAQNSLFLVFGFITFSDRLAMYSWYFIPVLLMVPLMTSKNAPVRLSAALALSAAVAYGVFFGGYGFVLEQVS